MGPTGNWDRRISRRTLLRTGGSAAAGLFLIERTSSARAAPPWAGQPFSLGIASGDPTPGGVVLWTRLAHDPLVEGGGVQPRPHLVRYEVAADEAFRRIVRRGVSLASPREAHTVHAEIAGLQPATPYWYRFKWGTAESPVGRTRTAPAAGTVAPMRVAFASCQNYTNGFYPAYTDMAQQELDLVVHLGDYIYEGPGLSEDRVRDHVPAAELLSLNDYRTRHAQYRTDPALQAAHAAFPWLMSWDDHEFEDNYADLDLDPDQPLEAVAARRAAAYLAYWEHAPLSRARKPVGKDMALYRRVHWGALATFHVLDSRQHRSDQIELCAVEARDPSGYCPDALLPERSMLGVTQRDWLLEGLGGSGASWNVLANQVGFAPIDVDTAADLPPTRRGFARDNWDGYVAERQLVLDFLAQRGLANTVVITGDAHQNSVRNVPSDFRSFDGSPRATEFVGTSISSEGLDNRQSRPRFGGSVQNPHVVMTDFHRGYVRVTLDPDTWTSDFRVVESVLQPVSPASTLATYVVQNGRPGAQRVGV